jgi:hypothetical protein
MDSGEYLKSGHSERARRRHAEQGGPPLLRGDLLLIREPAPIFYKRHRVQISIGVDG